MFIKNIKDLFTRYLPKYNNFSKNVSLKFTKNSKIRLSSKWLALLFVPLALHCQDLNLTKSVETSTKDTIKPVIYEINKPQLVNLLNSKQSGQFVVIVYEKFRRLKEQEFTPQINAFIQDFQKAQIKNVYLIDSKQVQHLEKIVTMLHDTSQNSSNTSKDIAPKQKQQNYKLFYKSPHFDQAFQLHNKKQYSLDQHIYDLRSFQIIPNKTHLSEDITRFYKTFNHPSKTMIVKQCFSDQCVQSYKQQISNLLQEDLLNGKTQQFKFQLVKNQASGLFGAPSQYLKNFQKSLQKLKGESLNATKKQDMYLIRNDIFGQEIVAWSQWLQKQGKNYPKTQRMMMFIKPRVHIISKINTFTDLIWYLKTVRLNPLPTLSLNNSTHWQQTNSIQSIQTLKVVHKHHPRLHYLINNTTQISQLIRHIHADHKYVIFQQSADSIWKKHFLNLDQLQNISDKKLRQKIFMQKYKPLVQDFINSPSIKSLVRTEKELQINLSKLKQLRDRQIKQGSSSQNKKYIIRICNGFCGRFLSEQRINRIKQGQQAVSIYWIDGKTQNVGRSYGDYILQGGDLIDLNQRYSEK